LLAIVAARLGWAPVRAVDVQPGSVEAALQNARDNDVVVEAQVLDLATQPAPTAGTVAANVPAWLHARVAASFETSGPGTALVSGFAAPEADGVLAAYANRGLRPVRQTDAHGWVVAVLEQRLCSLDG
jgi:ribosomal protein L11 methylase PrmA